MAASANYPVRKVQVEFKKLLLLDQHNSHHPRRLQMDVDCDSFFHSNNSAAYAGEDNFVKPTIPRKELLKKRSSEFARALMLPKRQRTLSLVEEDYRFSHNAQYDCSIFPIFIWTVTLIEIAFFICYVIQLNTVDLPDDFQKTEINKWLYYSTRKRHEVWRYCTYALVHKSFPHITFIVALQLTLGTLLEMVHDWWRVLLIYFSGVLGGVLAVSALMSKATLVGASAGAYALFAAHLSTVLLNYSEMEYPWVSIILFLLYVLWDSTNIVQCYHPDGAIILHMGGAVAGLLVGILVLRNLKFRKWEYLLYFISAILLVALVCFAVERNLHHRPNNFNVTNNNNSENYAGSSSSGWLSHCDH